MRTRAGVFASVVLAGAALLTPTSSAASERAALQDTGRSTTVRSLCQGGGRIVTQVDQSPDGSVTASITTHGLVDGTLWNGQISIGSADGQTGGAGGWGGRIVVNGSFTEEVTLFSVNTPIVVRVQTHAQDRSAVCRVAIRPEMQSAVSLCRLSTRRVSMTAVQNADQLDFSSRLRTVVSNSRWDVSVSVTSPHASQGFAASVRASDKGIVHVASSFDYVANRVLSIEYSDREGRACWLIVGTHRLQTAKRA